MFTRRRVFKVSEGNAEVKVYYDREFREYTCRIYINGKLQPDRDYFTDDEDDAIGSANCMLEEELENAA